MANAPHFRPETAPILTPEVTAADLNRVSYSGRVWVYTNFQLKGGRAFGGKIYHYISIAKNKSPGNGAGPWWVGFFHFGSHGADAQLWPADICELMALLHTLANPGGNQ